MKKTTLLFLIFLVKIFYSQSFKIIDSIDKKPISYAKIIYNNNEYYTDSLGILNYSTKFNNIKIYKSGYKTKNIELPSDEIYLSPIFSDIKEVKLAQKHSFIISNKEIKKNRLNIGFNYRIGSYISNPFNSEVLIKDIILPIYNYKRGNNNVLIITFHKINENGSIGYKPYEDSETIINFNKLKTGNNTINILNKKIVLPKEGIILAFKTIKNVGNDKNLIEGKSIILYRSDDNQPLIVFDALSNKTVKMNKELSLAFSLNILK